MTAPARSADGLQPVETSATRFAVEVLERYAPPALLNHAQRTGLWARALAVLDRLDVDVELLQTAALLHDLGLEEAFDSHRVPFERAGGELAWVFGAGAGWPILRRQRLADIIERHMWPAVDATFDVEAHLIERATSLDVVGSELHLLDPLLVQDVTARWPALDMAARFTERFVEQAERKPASAAARSVASGIASKMQTNPVLRQPDR